MSTNSTLHDQSHDIFLLFAFLLFRLKRHIVTVNYTLTFIQRFVMVISSFLLRYSSSSFFIIIILVIIIFVATVWLLTTSQVTHTYMHKFYSFLRTKHTYIYIFFNFLHFNDEKTGLYLSFRRVFFSIFPHLNVP